MTKTRPSFDLSGINLSPKARALLPISGGGSAVEDQRKFGTWWCFPFARTNEMHLIGLRAIPKQKLVECPVIYAAGPATVTIASKSRHTVPVLVFAKMASEPKYWKKATELVDKHWEELDSVHRVLGGDDDLAALRKIAGDDKLRARCQVRGSVGRAAVADVLDRLDPSPARKRVRDLLSGKAGSKARPKKVPPAWSAAIEALGFVATARLDRGLKAAWSIFHAPAGLDVCWSDPIDPWPQPVATEVAKRLHTAARLLAKYTTSKDPLWNAIKALADAESPFSFDGVAFIEAAAKLDEQGEPERAFNATTAVQFWSYLSKGPTMDGALEAAHMVAKRERWLALQSITEAAIAR